MDATPLRSRSVSEKLPTGRWPKRGRFIFVEIGEGTAVLVPHNGVQKFKRTIPSFTHSERNTIFFFPYGVVQKKYVTL